MMKHPSKYPHPSKRMALAKRQRPDPNLCVRRDEILEADPTFCENLRNLYRRVRAGKLPKEAVRSIQPNLVMAALRRAGFSLRHSEQLARA